MILLEEDLDLLAKKSQVYPDEDFSHNYTKIRIKCPECVRLNKVTRHCKVYKSLSGLWWHFKLEHGDVYNLDFDTNEFVEILRKVSKAVKLGMFEV